MEHTIEYQYDRDHTYGHREFWRERLAEARLDPTTADIPAWVQRAGVWVLLSDIAALDAAEPITPAESAPEISVADSAANAIECFGTEAD